MSSSYNGKTNRYSEWTTSLPEKGPLSYLFDWLCQIGLSSTQLSWQEIKAWSDLTGITPVPDECQALVQLSRVWSTEFIKGREKDALPPWLPEFD